MAEGEDLSLKEAARLVRSSESTLRRMIQSGRLEARTVQAGKRSRVLLDRTALLAAFGTVAPDGPGALATRRQTAAAVTPLAQDAGALYVRQIQDNLADRDRTIAALRSELADARAELREARADARKANEELKALLRQAHERGQEPRGVLGYLASFIRA